MSRVLRLTAAALFGLAAASAATAAPRPADTSALSVVPASAPVVVHLRGVEGTKDRFVAMLKNALPELAPLVEGFLDNGLKEGAMEGRKLRGLAKDGPVFVVFPEIPRPGFDGKNFAVVLAVTKYEEFRDNLLKEEERKQVKAEGGYESAPLDGDTVYFVNKKDYAVVSMSKEFAVAFTKKYKGIDEVISKEQSARLLTDDLGLYVSMDVVNKQYGDQIKLAKEAARDGLKSVTETVEASQRGAFLLMQKAVDPAFQAAEDSSGVVISVAFRPAGLALHLETELRPGTPTATALAANKLSAFKGLDAMPGGQLLYFGMESNKAMTAALGGLLFGMAVDPESKEAKEARSALDELVKADPGTRLDAFNIPMQGIQVTHYGEPAKALEAQMRLIRSLVSGGAYSGGKLKDKPKITPNAQKYGDFEFTSVELKWDVEKMIAGADTGAALSDDAKKQLGAAVKKLLGENQTAWIGTDGKVVLQVSAKDWAAAKKLLDARANGTDAAGSLAAFRDVRKELPAEVSMLALVDVVRYADFILDFARPVLDTMLPVKIPTAPANMPATYSGAAVTLKPDRAGLDVFISAATVRQMYNTYIKPLTGGAAGAAN